MGFIDSFLNAVKLNDEYDDDDEFFDDDEELEDDDFEEELPKQKSRFFKKMKQDDDFLDEEEDELPVKREKKTKPVRSSAPKSYKKPEKVTKMKSSSPRSFNDMEVSVIKPDSMENTREIADSLLAHSTVVLNMEGVDVDLAQRIIDFTCGTCYAIDGNLHVVTNYIFILTPGDVEISGDIKDVLNGGVPSMRAEY